MRQRRTFLAILTWAFCLSFFGDSGEAAGTRPEPPKLRLPATARPIGYAVDLSIDPAKESFRGSIDIQARFDEKTDVLWLNAAEVGSSL